MARGFGRPPRWAVILLAVGFPALVGLFIYAQSSGHMPAGGSALPTAAEPAGPTDPPASITVPAHPELLVFGDSYVQGNGASSGTTTFAQVAAKQLGWAVETSGEGGTGFLNGGPTKRLTYYRRLQNLDPPIPPDVIIVLAGFSDRGNPGNLNLAAQAALAVAQQRWPHATVILMTPVNPIPSDPWVAEAAGHLRAAAAAMRTPFIDASHWLTADNIGRYSNHDGVHVNQAGHDYMGARLADAVRALVSAGHGGR